MIRMLQGYSTLSVHSDSLFEFRSQTDPFKSFEMPGRLTRAGGISRLCSGASEGLEMTASTRDVLCCFGTGPGIYTRSSNCMRA